MPPRISLENVALNSAMRQPQLSFSNKSSANPLQKIRLPTMHCSNFRLIFREILNSTHQPAGLPGPVLFRPWSCSRDLVLVSLLPDCCLWLGVRVFGAVFLFSCSV